MAVNGNTSSNSAIKRARKSLFGSLSGLGNWSNNNFAEEMYRFFMVNQYDDKRITYLRKRHLKKLIKATTKQELKVEGYGDLARRVFSDGILSDSVIAKEIKGIFNLTIGIFKWMFFKLKKWTI